jgi:thioredoxin-dependent peroxiredoxin
VGVSFDSPAENRAFAQKNGFSFPLLSDQSRELALAVGAADWPEDAFPRRVTFVIGPEGQVEQAIETKDPGGQAGTLAGQVCGG